MHSKLVYMFLLLLTFAIRLLVLSGWNFAKPFSGFLHISLPHTTLQVPSCLLVYSYFEKGCRMKCTRQTRKVLWMVLSSLFFKEIWKNGTRGRSTVAQKGHTCKLKMLLQTKKFTCKLKMLLQIGQLHDDDIWLQLPEFNSVLLCYLNLSIPLRIKE